MPYGTFGASAYHLRAIVKFFKGFILKIRVRLARLLKIKYELDEKQLGMADASGR